MNIGDVQPIISSIIEANELFKRQAEERLNILTSLFDALDNFIRSNDENSELIDVTLQEIHDLHNTVNNIYANDRIKTDPKYLRNMKLQSINKIIGELDDMEMAIARLQMEKEELDQNLRDRDELIGILSEYVELENASNYKIVSEIAELDDIKYQFEKSLEMYTVLSKFDPRIQAVNILENYPNGISKHLMIKMLDITEYEANKIINELINMGMIRKKENSDILYSPETSIDLTILTR